VKKPNNIAQLIERIGRLVANANHENGFKPVQWETLLYLAQANVFSRNPRSLGEYLGVTKGSVSQTVSNLERRGLLRKKNDKADKRVVRLELTAAGRACVADIPLQELADSVGTLKAEQQQALKASLELVLREHLQLRDRKPFGQCRNCRYLQKPRGNFHCGLLNEPLKAQNTEQICAEFESIT